MKLHPSWNLKPLFGTLVFSCLATLALFSAQVGALEFSSGTKQTQLIELYTSEGCSSCPPADRWLTRLKEDPGLWREFVPVAFHVDYWDYIGWTDRFAKPSHAARQRQHAKLGNVKTVYTPGFVVNGTEWRGWFRRQALPDNSSESGSLSATLTDGELTLSFKPSDQYSQIIATVAALGADSISEVSRGENANKTLTHDFAVLSQQSIGLDFDSAENKFSGAADIVFPDNAKAIAVWVSSQANLRPLQATGTWLAGKSVEHE